VFIPEVNITRDLLWQSLWSFSMTPDSRYKLHQKGVVNFSNGKLSHKVSAQKPKAEFGKNLSMPML